MTSPNLFSRCLVLASLLLCFNAAHADWELDNDRSVINFVSVKNGAIGELHRFDSLMGFIGDDGAVKVAINLDSLETGIDIRNERMREGFFETGRFAMAEVSAQVEPALLSGAAEGAAVTAEVPVTLSLHGVEKTLNVTLVAVGQADGGLQVFSAYPVLLSAADFGLEAGVEALREIAGLDAISTVVPVTLRLSFTRAPAQ